MLVAIDRSTQTGSAALFSLEGNRVATVSDRGAGQGDALSLLDRLVRESGVDVRLITRFAVGIGPGSFSGIRSAIALLSGLALPIAATVEGVGSAAAADAVFRCQRPEVDGVAVVGDARRGRLWVSLFDGRTPPKNTAADFQVVAREDIARNIAGSATVITPDFNRIGPLLRTAFSGARVFAVIPDAEAVGRLALAGCSAEALPIYLSPAVS